MVIYTTLVIPSLWRLAGRRDWEGPYGWPLRAVASQNIPSVQGQEDYVRITLSVQNGTLVATPLSGKRSGPTSALIQGDGLLHIPMDSEGAHEGEIVEVWPF